METFCFIAFIPCIILVVWLLIEVRKYIIVRKRFKVVEERYNRAHSRDTDLDIQSDEEYIQPIPQPQNTYYQPTKTPYQSYNANMNEYDENDEYYKLYGEPKMPPEHEHSRVNERRSRGRGYRDLEEIYDKPVGVGRGGRYEKEYGSVYGPNYVRNDYPPPQRRTKDLRKRSRNAHTRSHRPPGRLRRGKRPARRKLDYDDDVDWD